jgi:hypothetical protein
MKTFDYRGFHVTVRAHAEGYLYFADNGSHPIADPNPGYPDGLYLTVIKAIWAGQGRTLVAIVISTRKFAC